MDSVTDTSPPRATGRAHVLIAVKELAHAKSRLAARLDADSRSVLVLAMLRDTLSTVGESAAVAGCTVVTPDPAVSALAHSLGADVFDDRVGPGPDRLNTVLRDAARAAGRPDAAVVVLQADLPCLRAAEVDAALASARSVRRAIVVDHHGTGTAALIVAAAAEGLDPHFGLNSARRHSRSGATALDGSWPGLRLDVDTPDDLDAAVAVGPGPATAAALRTIGWPTPARHH